MSKLNILRSKMLRCIDSVNLQSIKGLYQLQIQRRSFHESLVTFIAATDLGTTNGKVSNHYLEKTPITAQLWEMRSKLFQSEQQHLQRNDLKVPLATLTPEVITKSTSDSRHTINYNFQSDPKLRDLYVDPVGNIIIGKLFEDLDALAGNIAFTHCDDQNPLTKRLLLVTASVDRIVQKKVLSVNQNFVLTGNVCWVGKSSLVIALHMFSSLEFPGTNEKDSITNSDIGPSAQRALLSSYFTYVARDRDTGKAALVNKLKLSSAEEQELFRQRQEMVDAQKSKAKEKSAAQHEYLFHRLVEAGNVLEDMPALAHPNAVLMRSTALENSLVCQPQNVNTAGRVFGGYIMHKAYDLALATSYTFAGSYPVFLECDRISFRLPVDVGDLLRLKSRVVFTSDDPIQPKVVIEVRCQVISPEKASSVVSNTFSFTFGFQNGVSLRKVLPSTLEEASALLQGSEALEIPIVK